MHRGHTTSTTWRAASQPLTSCRIRRDPDACVVLGERKQSRLVRGAHASIACQHHTSGQRGHITSTTWRAANRSLTGCRIRRDPDACVVLGERKQSRLVRGAHASIACQHHTSGQQGHRIYTTWPGRNTHPRIEGTQQAPHGRQQADHSPAAEIGGIQMHVWGRTKEHNAGQSEGHMPA